MNLIQKIILLSCLIFIIHPASGYQPIPIIGFYNEEAEDVNVHLGDDTDPQLTPSDPGTVSYTHRFPMYNKLRRQEVRLVITVVNVLPSGAKEEGQYDDRIYINDNYIANLNDLVAGTQQDYESQQVELIFSSELLHRDDNTLTITAGANFDKSNYDDFVIESIYMEQYGGLKHWLFSYIPPGTVILLLVGVLIILAGSGYYLNRSQELPAVYQFLLAGAMGAVTGMIFTIKIQDNLFGIVILLGAAAGILIFVIALAGLAAVKYLLHRNILPVWFITFLRPLIFLVLILIFFIWSNQYFYFDPGGPKPTYGVPPHRPGEK